MIFLHNIHIQPKNNIECRTSGKTCVGPQPYKHVCRNSNKNLFATKKTDEILEPESQPVLNGMKLWVPTIFQLKI